MILQLSLIEPQRDFEIVEKKCVGHPDTLADGLAEYLSQQYALYTKEKFGVILHHNFDKVGLLGGASYVKFGEGFLTSPIRVLLNGRASTKFADCNIPVNELLTNWSREFLKEKLPLLDVEKDIVFLYNLSNQSSPGKTEEKQRVAGTRKFWFEPRGIFDLQEQQKLFSNDTSLGVGYYPYSTLEKIVDAIAYKLTEDNFKYKNPWIGTDIKIMGYRNKDIVNITLCVPQISRYVYSDIMYKAADVEAKYGYDPRKFDLSRIQNWDQFVEAMNYAMMKQFTALEKGGRMAVLMGDIKKKGKLYSMISEIIKPGTLENIIIKTQHNCFSDNVQYSGKFIPILHEYVLIVRKDNPLIIPIIQVKKKDVDIRDMEGASWRDIVAAVLEQHDDAVSLESLYQEIEPYKKTKTNQWWKEKIRQTLQINPEYFLRTGRGMWKLVKEA